MKTYKVRKGLDAVVKIKGMYFQYFYIWVGAGVLFSVIGLATLLSFIRSDSSISIWTLCGVILFLGISFFALQYVFIRLSNTPKIGKGKHEVTISNADIFEMLRQNTDDSNS